jgi:hypothetical protein
VSRSPSYCSSQLRADEVLPVSAHQVGDSGDGGFDCSLADVAEGYPAAFALAGALILAAVPAAVRQRNVVASVAPPM